MNSNNSIQSKIEVSKSLSKKQIFIKVNFFALLITIAMLLISLLFLSIFAYSKFNRFLQVADVSKSDFYQTITTGWEQIPTETDDYKNILVLGVDTLETRGDSTPLTDSIMISSTNLQTGKITLLPLLRDLWNEAYQTKINALYTYGLERYPENPEQFPKEVIAEMTGLDIHHTLVISMETVAEVIDLAGGVEMNVRQGFIDQEFPRTDIDVTIETNPKKLYETIEFKTGLQTMNGETALKYMRSRHGSNDQNTDNSRSDRQQEVIQALVKKLANKKTLLNTEMTGQLYRYYLDNFADSLSIAELIATAKALLPVREEIMLENKTISVYPTDSVGTIEHPAQYLYDGQWVYVIRDQAEFELNIKNQLTK